MEYFLLNELVKDPDGYHKSTFMFKTGDSLQGSNSIIPGKVFAGPLWDKNKSYGNYGGDVTFPCPDTIPSSQWADPVGFLYCAQQGGQAPWWWSVLLLSEEFKKTASDTWIAATKEGGILTAGAIGAYIDEQRSYLDDQPYPNDPGSIGTGAIQRELKRWPGLAGLDLKDWIFTGYEEYAGRIEWLQDNFHLIGISTKEE